MGFVQHIECDNCTNQTESVFPEEGWAEVRIALHREHLDLYEWSNHNTLYFCSESCLLEYFSNKENEKVRLP